MNKMFLIIPCIAIVVAGCSAIPLKPGAEKVIVSNGKVPKNCKYINQVTGNQGNSYSGSWTTNANLDEGAMNNLRNKAYAMGANFVQLIANPINSGIGELNAQTTAVALGNAYYCKGLAD